MKAAANLGNAEAIARKEKMERERSYMRKGRFLEAEPFSEPH